MIDRHSRQSFLGAEAPAIIQSTTIGLVGLGGGGSHIAQQLAHVGFVNFIIFDPDRVEHSNLNRLVGATYHNAVDQARKSDVVERIIKAINPEAVVASHPNRWEDGHNLLKRCDILFGCLDSIAARRDFEAFARRHLLPYIDIGLDVHQVEGAAPEMGGQVIVSMPGGPCMRCMGFITDDNLAAHAAQYGDAGIRPQVVWANGVLASAAVGVAVDLLTDWTGALRTPVYLSYDSNRSKLEPHVRLQYLQVAECPHYSLTEVGDLIFRPL
ncbi:MAG TPA: ThiF family adenylyltransferase [Oscillatoriaceae cyanobacterium]